MSALRIILCAVMVAAGLCWGGWYFYGSRNTMSSFSCTGRERFKTMRHWYLLGKSPHTVRDRAAVGFTEGGGPARNTLSVGQRRKMFWLGLVEATPLGGGVAAQWVIESPLPDWMWIGLGCGFCVGLCWLLRHHTPPTVIHLAEETQSPVNH